MCQVQGQGQLRGGGQFQPKGGRGPGEPASWASKTSSRELERVREVTQGDKYKTNIREMGECNMFQQKDNHKTSLRGRSIKDSIKTIAHQEEVRDRLLGGKCLQPVCGQDQDHQQGGRGARPVQCYAGEVQQAVDGQEAHHNQDRLVRDTKTGWYETSCWGKCVSSRWVDRTTAVEEEATSATQEKSSKQRPDRIYLATQQEKYKTGWYETNCWEESVSSQWLDRIKTINREAEVLA